MLTDLSIKGLKLKDHERKIQWGELANLAMECMGVAVTIIDIRGTLLYYNKESAKIFIFRDSF
jgi:hypothetical protein